MPPPDSTGIPRPAPLWWACARVLAADNARAEARTIALELDDDPARIDLSLELPEGALVAVIPDAAGGSDLAYDLAGMRDDLEVVDAGDFDARSQAGERAPAHRGGRRRPRPVPGRGRGRAAAVAEARETGAAVGCW